VTETCEYYGGSITIVFKAAEKKYFFRYDLKSLSDAVQTDELYTVTLNLRGYWRESSRELRG